MSAVTLVPKAVQRRDGDIAFMEGILAQFRSGEIIACVLLIEHADGYRFERVNINIEKALGLHMRSIHNLNREWDNYAVQIEDGE